MVVANALKLAFTGLQITYDEYVDEVTKGATVTKDVQFSWGDQKELNKWIAGRTDGTKYPLIWYVMSPYTNPKHADYFEVNGRIILFTSTQQKFYNETRALINYTEILNPLYDKIKALLLTKPYVQIIDQPLSVIDEPCYGVDIDRQGVASDFSSVGTKGTKSIASDYLDAKAIDLKLRINKIQQCNL